MLEQLENGSKNFNTVMFYAASTVVLAPVAGLAAAVATGIFAAIAYAQGTEAGKKLAEDRFAHIPAALACTIPGVATIGLLYMWIAVVIGSKGSDGNTWDLAKAFA